MDSTRKINFNDQSKEEMRAVLIDVYKALLEKGYNPVDQIVGYLLSEDPTYITGHRNARTIIRHLDRDELMHELVKAYLGLRT